MKKKLTAAQYLAFLKTKESYYVSEDMEIEVSNDVVLPEDITSLPKCKTVFNGSVDARETKLEYFNCEVKKNGIFTGVISLIEFGNKSNFGGALWAEGVAIKGFNNSVQGSAHFVNCNFLQEFGPDACFGASLWLSGSSIRKFDSKVDGDVSFNGVETLTEIGPEVLFKCRADFRGTGLKEFNNTVLGDADFRDTYMREIGSNAKFGGDILLNDRAKIESFDNEVKGNADFSNVKSLKKVGPNTKVDGMLDITGTSVRVVDIKSARTIRCADFTRICDLSLGRGKKLDHNKGFDL